MEASVLGDSIGVEDWRQRESKELSELVQSRIHELQNPYGFSSGLSDIVWCLIAGYYSNRTVVLLSKRYHYLNEGSQKWTHFFKPLSDTCDESMFENVSSGHSTSNPLFTKIYWQENSGHAFKPIGLVVGLHVRRTDKIGVESSFHNVSEYMVHIKDFYDGIGLLNDTIERKVYLATDDPQVCRVAYELMQNNYFDAGFKGQSIDLPFHYETAFNSPRVVIYNHFSSSDKQWSLRTGDMMYSRNGEDFLSQARNGKKYDSYYYGTDADKTDYRLYPARPPNGRYFRRSYRTAPPGLVPAIISCQASVCLIMFGIFFLIAGSIARFVAGDDSPPSKDFDTPFFNKGREEFARGPRIVGTILLCVGAVMTGIAVLGFVTAFVLYRKYERNRRSGMVAVGNPHTIANPQVLGPTPTSGVDYPTQAGYQYGPGYQAVSQNVVYSATTEPTV
ncbi:unnamed protein product [Medioppia subpectinata]|uniref:Alpha-(1,6)-fucosyltransferase N- and catalytic domain-containing protein n=1 Tax=Medioppia subpectinata TaxID=1979941 RepID=A0A7R9L6W4_9ACAR|nr:unnamed protein product [Medioppia subpectinata]CAG2116257.1 unnamed protein product [Medioppia subpectinata]